MGLTGVKQGQSLAEVVVSVGKAESGGREDEEVEGRGRVALGREGGGERSYGSLDKGCAREGDLKHCDAATVGRTGGECEYASEKANKERQTKCRAARRRLHLRNTSSSVAGPTMRSRVCGQSGETRGQRDAACVD
jgi:hypothetical protein